MTNSSVKPPVWFWIVSVVALIWNAMGVNAYLQQVFNTESYQEMYPQDQIDFVANQPAWVTAAFAIAVFGGVLASVALLLRKKWSYTFFLISLIAVIIQMSYYLYMDNIVSWPMTIMILVFAILFLLFSKMGVSKGWLS